MISLSKPLCQSITKMAATPYWTAWRPNQAQHVQPTSQRHYRYRHSECQRTQEPRFNPLGIEMLPDKLYKQVFGFDASDRHGKSNLQRCIQHLKGHDLLPKQPTEINTILESKSTHIDIPKIEGTNIDQHFNIIGRKFGEGYRDMALDLIENATRVVELMPEVWSETSGWTRYVHLPGGGHSMTKVDYPLENNLIFDVETCMNDPINHAPTMAVAVSSKAWYSWTSPRLVDKSSEIQIKTKLSIDDLIPFKGEVDKEKLIIGHNVGFDRSFLSDQYELRESKTKFLDTLSLHVCICGLSGLQRLAKVAQKRKMKDNEPVEYEDLQKNQWLEMGSLNNLADVYEFHCGSQISKDDRKIFVEGTMNDVRDNYQSLMTYCATDVKATFEVFSKLFSIFTQRFPHPITLAGMLEMSTMYLPVDTNNWFKYIERSQQVFDESEQRLSIALQELANKACSLREEEYSKDVWLWDIDWSKQSIVPNKAKLAAWQKTKHKLGPRSIDEQVKELWETKSFMRQIQPFLPGFPKWYRELCCPYDKASSLLGDKEWQPGPCLITTQMRITPKLMQLTWDNYPLHFNKEHGWGYLVPNDDLVAQYTKLPDDHPYAKFPTEELRKISEGLDRSHILIEDHPICNADLEDDLVKAKIEELKENTQLATPNLIKLLRSLSKKKKIRPRYAKEYCEDVDIPGAYFIKLPHKNGPDKNVGNPLGKDFVTKMESGILSSLDDNLARLLLKHSASLSYWKNNHKRIKNQMVVPLSDQSEHYNIGPGAILPRVIVAGTVTRRAVEPTWLTASNQDTTRIGSELKAMIQAPDGYCFVGADVDSQELWIASLMGDSYSFKIHGGTGLSYMTLCGSKSDKTDMHSKTASLIGITRSDAKVLNYARIYGAGQKFIERFLINTIHNLKEDEAKEKARRIYQETKGVRKFHSKPPYWEGGTESATFNKLEEIASSAKPRTPVLNCQISQALEPSRDEKKDFVTSRVNWVVQSSAVDFLHLLLINMKWLFKELKIDGRFSISIHDEVRYLVRDEDKYKAAFALQVSNLLVRAYFAYKLNMKDLPISVAFFSKVDLDKCLRKEVDMDCKSPSNPFGLKEAYNMPYGESLDIQQILNKYTNNKSIN